MRALLRAGSWWELSVALADSRRGLSMQVFDSSVKRIQRDVAASRPNSTEFDYLKNEVSRRLADRVLDLSKKDFPVCVDVGCGTGWLGKFLGNNGNIRTLIQMEKSEKMLSRDLGKPSPFEPIPPMRTTHNVVCSEEFLPLAPNSVDLALSSMSLHWVNDLPDALEQIRKSLKPDGVFMGAMLGGETLQELRSCLALADTERKGGVQPHLSPFVRLKDAADLLSNAGFTMPTIDTEALTVSFPDMFTLLHHLQGMAEQNAPVGVPRSSRDVFLAAASAYEALYADDHGVIPATFQVVYMIGWAPHESQPKPLARGSGRSKLQDLDRLLLEGTQKTPD